MRRATRLQHLNQMGTTGDFVKIFEQNGFKMENMGKMSFSPTSLCRIAIRPAKART